MPPSRARRMRGPDPADRHLEDRQFRRSQRRTWRDSPISLRMARSIGSPWVWGLTAFAFNEKIIRRRRRHHRRCCGTKRIRARSAARRCASKRSSSAASPPARTSTTSRIWRRSRRSSASLMPQIKTFWTSENDWNQMHRGRTRSTSASTGRGSAARAKTAFKLPVSFVVPRKARSAGSTAFSIPAGSKNVEAPRPSSTS